MRTKDLIMLGAGYAAGRLSKKTNAGFIGATSSKLKSLTSNQYYKGLNNRFDKRVKKLKKLNAQYSREEKGFYPKGQFKGQEIDLKRALKRGYFMDNTFLMFADNRAFEDRLKKFKS